MSRDFDEKAVEKIKRARLVKKRKIYVTYLISNIFSGKRGVKLLPNMTAAERMALLSTTGRIPSLTSTTRRIGMGLSMTTVCPRLSPGIF